MYSVYAGAKKRSNFLFAYLLNLPLLVVALGFVIGIILQYLSLFKLGYIMLLFPLALIFTHSSRVLLTCLVFCLFLNLGALHYDSYLGYECVQKIESVYDTTIYNLEVLSMPESAGNFNYKVYVVSENVPGKILMKYPKRFQLKAGDVLEGEFFLEEPENFEGFDYKFYLMTQGVFYTSEVFDFEVTDHEVSIFSVTSNFKQGLSGKIRKVMPEPHASLAAGLVWGERANMPESFEDALSATGTTHIIAVSGFNVSLLVMYFLKLAGLLPRRVVEILAGMFLVFFLILVGLDNLPAMRAGIMGMTVLISKSFGRKTSILSLLAASVLVLSLLNPLSIFTVSFQLSFAATIGLIGLDKVPVGNLSFPAVVKKLKQFLSKTELPATFNAIVATSPITLVNFETFSVVALLVNFLILPFISFLTVYSIVVSLVVLLSIDLAKIVAFPAVVLMDIVIWIINSFGGLTFSSVDVEGFGQLAVIAVYLFLGAIIIEFSYRANISKIKKYTSIVVG